MSEQFDVRLDQLYRQLADVRAAARPGGASGSGGQPSTVEGAAPGIGTAFGGAVEAVAERGRLRAVTLDPRLLRMAETELAEALGAAVSRALEADRAGAAATAGSAERPADLAALADQVEATQFEAARAARLLRGGLDEAIAAIARRRNVSGDPDLSGLEMLLDEVGGALRAARGADRTAGEEVPAATTTGRGGDITGLIAAEVDGSGLLVTLTLHPRAARLASQELADGTVGAVNAALAGRERALTEATGVPDPAAMTSQLQELQELQVRGVAQLRRQIQSLTDITNSIEPR
ncbi:hypothetical protein KZZ52_33865 [Dactylosporangium sp. AC04546]|uniref:hypothetical protein n=1 Tax=Dactylosporangium sp. AC04546 TaxID=2862460 RepID=UPI001EDCF9C6|nr:hypothetical protein [Dactylosporangium sp. AC04546]WVK78963.1 hypothetical protein KZZ52_33865 [Dactylosporangium sp. AC04546]